MSPTVVEELKLWNAGRRVIAGVDEVGRGCWAGPVVAAAVVLPQRVLEQPELLAGVDDSKALTARQRAELCEQVLSLAVGWGIGAVPAHVIDTHGILNATRLAMQIAVLRLPIMPNALLIDAVRLEHWPHPQRSLIRGDSISLSIAAASVVAKVARDRLMVMLSRYLPAYGFAAHKGYGTAVHARALRLHGPSMQHRRTFRPLSDFLTHGVWPNDARVEAEEDDAAVVDGVVVR